MVRIGVEKFAFVDTFQVIENFEGFYKIPS